MDENLSPNVQNKSDKHMAEHYIESNCTIFEIMSKGHSPLQKV